MTIKHGFNWDLDAWREKRLARQRAKEEEKKEPLMTEYQNAVYTWHLKQKMAKRFGHREWMNGVVDPDTLQWNEDGSRYRKPGARMLKEDHTIIPAPKKRRRLLH